MVGFWPLDSQYGGKDLSGNNNHMFFHEMIQHPTGVVFLPKPESFAEIKTSSSLRLHKKLSWFGSVTILSMQDGPLFSWGNAINYGVHIFVNRKQFYVLVDYEQGDCYGLEYLDELAVGQMLDLGVSVDVVNAVLTMWVNGKNATKQMEPCDENLDTAGSVYVGSW